MINPNDRTNRGRLAQSVKHWHKEHSRYRHSRAETIMMHAGSKQWASSLGIEIDKRTLGNLIQLSAQAHSITLAYGVPQTKVVPNVPEADHVAKPLEMFLNRWAKLLSLDQVAREVALDSFFGYGVIKVADGLLPTNVQNIVKQQAGPMVRRLSQDNFMFDGDATSWDYCQWMADTYWAPLDDVRRYAPFQEYNPERLDNLEESSRMGHDNESRLHSEHGHRSAQAMVRLIDVYLPSSGVIATWPLSDTSEVNIEGVPLLVRKWNGHHRGPYMVLSHLDVPDNLIPVAESESTKGLHILFNELADKTSNQATQAKVNPVYETGSHNDMRRLEDADDRAAVPVSDIRKIGTWEKPGPTQSQTAYMNASLQLFKEFSGNLDDVLGLGQTAGTAGQSKLIRQATGARGADKRRRMNSLMQRVFESLAHLVLNDQTLSLPAREEVGNTGIFMDQSWTPPHSLARNGVTDDFQIDIVPYSLEYRDPADRLAQLNEASTQVFQAMQIAQQGAPLDIAAFVEIQADYRDLPELRRMYNGLLPDFQKRTAAAQEVTAQRPNVGQYIRENVSTESNDGALAQNLTQAVGGEGTDDGGVTRVG